MKNVPTNFIGSILTLFGCICSPSYAWPETQDPLAAIRPLARPEQSASNAQKPLPPPPIETQLSNDAPSTSGSNFDSSACLQDYIETTIAAALDFLNNSDTQSASSPYLPALVYEINVYHPENNPSRVSEQVLQCLSRESEFPNMNLTIHYQFSDRGKIIPDSLRVSPPPCLDPAEVEIAKNVSVSSILECEGDGYFEKNNTPPIRNIDFRIIFRD